MTNIDTIIFNTLRVEALTLTKNQRTSLESLIKNGTGFVSLHISSCLPEDWPKFHDLTGGGWIMGTSTHPPYGQFRVDVTNPSHPCASDIGEFVTNDELYTKIGWQPGNDVFLSARLKEKEYPMAWTRSYFKGRVFNTVLGHDGLSFQTPSFQQLVLNGIRWVSSKDEINTNSD